MRHPFFLFLFLLAPLAPLHSAQEPYAALAELRSDAEKGLAKAQYNLGVRYANGDGFYPDITDGLEKNVSS